MDWLLVGVLVIIWVVLLLPSGRLEASPASSVEEFERKMGMLAEANGSSSGRWVLIPRKEERFLGPRDRQRARIRRRRRLILSLLSELALLTLIIGLFPPLRPILVGTAVFGGLLLLYLGLLVKIRIDAVNRRKALRQTRLAQGVRVVRDATASVPYVVPPQQEVSRDSVGWLGTAQGAVSDGARQAGQAGSVTESGVRIVEDGVHVVVRQAKDTDREGSHALAR